VIGATVIATASTPRKLEICSQFGADFVVNYTDKDWIGQIKKITKGKGCDVIYDPVGLVDHSLKVVAWNGRILIIGFAAGKIEKIAMNKALLKQVKHIPDQRPH
jgi:NADPH2:quinone reductase